MKGRNLVISLGYTLGAIILSLPYLYYMVVSDFSRGVLAGDQRLLLQALLGEGGRLGLVLFGSCLIGLTWSRQTGLAGVGNVHDLRQNWQRILIYGGFIGMVVYTFGDRYFLQVAPEFYPTQLLVALFVPFYAALVEEVFARFGVMTLLKKIFQNVHIANILAALIFAVGHVNMFQVAGIIYRLNYLTVCSFVLNLGISLFFGYIYWKKGLMTAMAIHFVANLRYLLIALVL